MSDRAPGSPPRGRLDKLIRRLRKAPAATIPRRPRPDQPAPLSFGQERLWFLDRLRPGSAAYNMPGVLRLSGSLDPVALGAALGDLVARHEILRSRFTLEGQDAAQAVGAVPADFFSQVDLAGVCSRGGSDGECEPRRLFVREAVRPFDLSRGPLLRAFLLRLAPAEHLLLLVAHHIVFDGASLAIFLDQLAALYEARVEGHSRPLAALPLQYADYALWQRRRLDEVMERELEFWRRQLEDLPTLELPTDRPRPPVPGQLGDIVQKRFAGPAERAVLERLAQERGATPFVLLTAVFECFLARWSGQRDFTIGTPVAGRERPELEGLIGFFVNTVVVRCRHPATDRDGFSESSFSSFLDEVRPSILAALEHREIPYERLVAELRPRRRGGSAELFQVMMSLEDGDPWERRLAGGLSLALEQPPSRTAKFDLTLIWRLSAEGLSAALEYDRQLFDRTTVRRVLDHLAGWLGSILADPHESLSGLSLSSPAERHQMLFEWNDTGDSRLREEAGLPVHRLVARQASRQPRALAVADAEKSLTYGELLAAARRLAGRLREHGVGPESRVGIFVERSTGLVVALFGVLEAGAAYVPFDPAIPPERLAFQLADAGAPVVVTSKKLRPALAGLEGKVVLALDDETLDDETAAGGGPAVLRDSPGTRAAAAGGGLDHLAYVIYTSGSTGRPKGALLGHRGLRLLADWKRRRFGLTPADRTTQVASPSFDATVWEVWPALVAGASIHLPPAEIAGSPRRLIGWLGEHRITDSWQPTPLGEALIDELASGGVPAGWSLRALNVAGDRFHAAPPPGLPSAVFNIYGPTEATVATSGTVVRPGDPRVPSIGRPFAHCVHLVVDRDLRLVPLGARGELAIAGPGLARGYHGRPGLTAERFVPLPWAGEPGARLYRSGDLVRHRGDGELDFLGRIDHQVKVRGYRIELGEIEAALREDPRVREALVAPQVRPGDLASTRLVAWLTWNEAGSGDASESELASLRAALGRRLPEYMVPAIFVPLAAMPLLPSGKIDRKAVLRDALPGWEGTEAHVAPRTPLEMELAGIWSELLDGQRVGVTDDFFALGGHSLLATRLLGRIAERFGEEIELRRFFDSPTVSDLAANLEAARSEPAAALPPLAPVVRPEAVPLSFAQERLWLLDQLDPGQPVYNLPAALRLRGPARRAALSGALNEIVRRHEVLRTTFARRDDQALQAIAPRLEIELPLIDLGSLPPAARDAEIERRVLGDARAPFDLERGPLLRVALLGLGDSDHVMLVNMHHIVSDGWSLGIFLRELGELYRAASEGRRSPLPELAVQYADFAIWQRAALTGDDLERQLAFWRQRLDGVPVLELPFDRPRSGRLDPRGATHPVDLPARLVERLEELAREEGATLFMVLLAAWHALLTRISGQRDFATGTPIANRRPPQVESLIGFFVNTLVLRAELGREPIPETAGAREPSFRELVGRLRRTTLDAYAHQDIPFQKLVEELAAGRQLDVTPFFQAAFALQNVARQGEIDRNLSWPGLALEPYWHDAGVAKFDLGVQLAESSRGLEGWWAFRTGLFDRSTVARLAGHFAVILEAAAGDPEVRFDELPLLTEAERHQARLEWNDQTTFPGGGLLHEFALRSAALTPNRIAFELGDRSWTFADIAERAHRLAHVLRSRGVGPEVPVGVFLERSVELVVGLLAILEAGGAYVPLDPDHPAERTALILDDAGTRLVLTTSTSASSLAADGLEIVAVDALDAELGAAPSTPPASRVAAENAAYLIYTSGSTGRPKGVVISHRAITRRLAWMVATELDADGVFLQKTSIGFDASLAEIFGSLAAGARAVAAWPGREKDVAHLVEMICSREITHASFPRALLEPLLDDGSLSACGGLRQVLVGGEKVPDELPDRFFGLLPGTTLENRYGPTESTISVTTWRCRRGVAESPLPIGRPIAGAEIALLDRWGGLAAAGTAGELAIGGPGLAREYFGQPAATAAVFVPHPFSAQPGARLYRSGDLARWRPDGALEFLGRIDDQVKVRGFRVEPGEIEAVLRHHPQIREAAVIDLPDGATRRLVAHVVAGSRLEAAALRRYLDGELPEYMVPSALSFVERMPLTPTGKVDRRALAEAAPQASAETAYVAPRGPEEELLAGLWASVLERHRVGVEDDFFVLGGHSLLATRLISRLREVLGVEVELRTVFEAPTVAAFAARLESIHRAATAGAPPLRPVPRPEPPPLSFAQERLWFLEQLATGQASYNMPAAVRLSGELDPAALAAALGEIVRRHEALRTTFAFHGRQPVQIIAQHLSAQHVPAQHLPTVLPIADLAGLSAAAVRIEAERLMLADARQPFDLERGPLLRAALLRCGEREHVLLLSLHHIVSDGWSMGILLRELAALYGAARGGAPSPLPELVVQYADYAVWQRQWLAGGELERQLEYWRRASAGVPDLELPFDRPRGTGLDLRGARHDSRLPAAVVERLASLAKDEGATLFMILVAAYNACLARICGQRDFAVGTPIANRRRPEVEGLIGFFVNTLVLRADLSPEESSEPSFRVLVHRARRTALAAYAHQDIPFQKLVEELAPDRRLAVTPFFQAVLALQDTLDGDLELPGLCLEPLRQDAGLARFDLGLQFSAPGGEGDGWRGYWAYRTALFDRSTIARLAEQFTVLLEAAVANPDLGFDALPLLVPAVRHQIVAEWNDQAGQDTIESGLFHELFLDQVRRNPDRLAAIFEALEPGDPRRELRYGELAERAHRLAHELVRRGIGPETIVGVCAGRSAELLVSLVAVLEAGGAFLPLDPATPSERMAFMIEDAGAELILATREAGIELPVPIAGVEDLERAAASFPAVPPRVAVQPENSAYVIYTSGSTGRPKGVVIAHRSVARRFDWVRRYDLDESFRYIQKTSISFDAAVGEIFAPLLVGGRMIVARPGGERDSAHLLNLVRDHAVTDTFFQPALLTLVLSDPSAAARFPALRRVLTGAEAVTPEQVERFQASFPEVRLENRYGPTESTIAMTRWVCRAGETTVPIGRPIAGASVRLVDRRGRLAPIGVAAELGIGGALLARGYLRRPARTAAVFVPDAWGERGSRLYRTGDLARQRHDGALEFLGRIDTQVKIRGYRVELGEIEAALRRRPGVRQAVVIDLPDGATRRLVAYALGEGEIDTEGLRSGLERELPEYMVPSAIAVLEELPLNLSGKVDRRALASMAPAAVRATAECVPPRTSNEKILAGLWTSILGQEQIGVDDDFFERGGNSISAALLVHRLQDAYGAPVPVAAIFEAPTIAALARYLEERTPAAAEGRSGAAAAVEPRPAGQNDVPLTSSQRWYWRLDRSRPGHPAYNLPLALELTGPLDVAALRAALAEIGRRHEALRTTFPLVDGEPVQRIEAAERWEWAVIDGGALPRGRRQREIERRAWDLMRRSFDLERGPLFRAALLRRSGRRHALILAMHHIVCDGWSVGILRRELAALYSAAVEGTASPLWPLPVQVPDFALWEYRRPPSARAELLAWWRERLAGASRSLELPGDRPRPARRSLRGGVVSLTLDAESTRELMAFARQRGVTLFMVLLAAFEILLCELTGSDDFLVGTQVANRERAEIRDLVGYFVNLLPLRADLTGDPTVVELLDRVRETSREALAHQEMPILELVEALGESTDGALSPLFQVLYTLQNAWREDAPGAAPAQLPGLEISVLQRRATTARFDLSLVAVERAGGLTAAMEYASDLFDEERVAAWLERWQVLLRELVRKPEQRFCELGTLPVGPGRR